MTGHFSPGDPVIVAILTILERETYWWVECSTCEYGWQVAHYAAESRG